MRARVAVIASITFSLLSSMPWPCAGKEKQDTIPKPPPSPFPIIIIANPDSTCPALPRDTVPPPVAIKCPKPPSANTAGSGGLQHVLFYTRHGVIDLRMPVDILPGDTVSASILTHPSGVTEAQKSRNLARLRALSVRIGDAQLSPGRGIETFSLEAPPGRAGMFIDLVDSRNRVLEVGGIGFQAADSDLAMKPRVFVTSSLGAAGHELSIEGDFDGNTKTTQVAFNGVPAEILSETPHGLTVVIPRDQVGLTEIVVRESKKTAVAADFRAARIDITAEDPHIEVGKMTRVWIEVEGAKGIGSPIGIVVSNMASSVIELIGGDKQLFRIDSPPDGEGRVSFPLWVLGKSVGTGSLTADFATFSDAHFIPQD